MRVLLAPALLLLALMGSIAEAGRRPSVDRAAMREAIAASTAEDGYASPASYAHFLRSRLLSVTGNLRGAVDELRLALVTDEGNPLLLTRLAETYARLGDTPRAERELRRVVERQPDFYPARVLMGRVLLEAGRPSRARLHLRKALRLRPREPEAYLVLAQLYLDTRSPDKAVKVVEALAQALPGETSGDRGLGLALAERGDAARAEPLLKRAAERDPGDVEVLKALAQLHEDSGRLDGAEDVLARALERDPDDAPVLLWAGRLALRLGSVTRARAYFDRLLALSEDPELTVKVAVALITSHQPEAAAEVLEGARRRGEDSPRIAFYAGLVQERLRRFPEAAAAYAEVPPGAEFFDDARRRRAICLSRSGDTAGALALLQAALGEAPEDMSLHILHARVLERGGQLQRAEAVLRAALALQPTPPLYEALSSTWRRQGRTDEALALLRQAVGRYPKDTSLRYALGTLWQQRGNVKRAIAEMRGVLALEPEHAEAMNFIGYLLAVRGKALAEAERLVLRALELRPDTGAFLDSLGWLYHRRGDSARAIEVLERAAALEPEEPVILEHLGDVYRKVARPEDAARAWGQALEVLKRNPEAAEPPQQRALIERKLKMLSTGAPGR